MTNRELAERIALAVAIVGATTPEDTDPAEIGKRATDAVLDVMHETRSGFVRLDVDPGGATIEWAMDDDAEAMEQRAQQSVKERQAGLFHE